jgi:hypothetical protein
MNHAALKICHRCPRRQPVCQGRCVCLEDGKDIIDHARSGECPLNYFQFPPDPVQVARIPLAGDLLEAALAKFGADRFAKWWEAATGTNCGCKDRKAKINRLDAAIRRRLGIR